MENDSSQLSNLENRFGLIETKAENGKENTNVLMQKWTGSNIRKLKNIIIFHISDVSERKNQPGVSNANRTCVILGFIFDSISWKLGPCFPRVQNRLPELEFLFLSSQNFFFFQIFLFFPLILKQEDLHVRKFLFMNNFHCVDYRRLEISIHWEMKEETCPWLGGVLKS